MSDRFYMVPSTRLGRTEDVLPERITSGAGDWIAHGREMMKKRRQAAHSAGKQVAPENPLLAANGAESCPAMAELDSTGWLLKWPATAVLKQVAPKGWEIKPSTNFNFFHYTPLTSFAEGGEAEAILVEAGFTIVTPPGWSVLVKNLPNQLEGRPSGLIFAEGVLRADRATWPLKIHAFIKASAKEIKIRRGEPMIAIFPFKREPLDLGVIDDPAVREEVERHAEADRAAFANAPGTYRKIYVEGDNPSPLYPRLDAAFRKSS